VVLDPKNGQVLAMASYPTYDPSLFVPAISNADYGRLSSADPTPLLNRAVQGQYYPGSTFKLITALAGLKDGIINPSDYYDDTGVYEIQGCQGVNAQSGCVKTNAGRDPLGPVDLRLAIAKSSDTYFYKVGDEFWQSGNRQRFGDTPIQDMAREFGFGQKTGIELPDESAGYVETPASRKQRHDENPTAFPYGDWTSGANTDTAIGQTTLVTPLQLANAYATFANGGTRYQPTLLLKVTKPFSAQVVVQQRPKVLSHVDIPPQFRDPMLAGFEGATTINGGTATGVFANYPMNALPVAGKTGTAQNGVDPKTGHERQDTGLFVGFGPPVNAQYVAMAVLEQAGFGADTAAPVVRDFFEPLASGGGFPVVPAVNTPSDSARSAAGIGPPGPGDSG
jgi:penicillin-binding protein 2